MYKQGQIIAINGNLCEYVRYDEKLGYHIVSEMLIDNKGNLTSTHMTVGFTTEELENDEVNFTTDQWCGIVEHFIRRDYTLSDEDVENAAMDIVGRCFAYGILKIEELPQYIAEYLNR